MKKAWIVLVLLAGLAIPTDATPQEFVHIRVVDCGQGLCCIACLPNDQYFVYDAGFKTHINSWNVPDVVDPQYVTHYYTTIETYPEYNCITDDIQEFIPSTEDIDLVVVSHNDEDHINGIQYICENYYIKEVFWTGYGVQRSPAVFGLDSAITSEFQDRQGDNINLQSTSNPPGFDFDDVNGDGLPDVVLTVLSCRSQPYSANNLNTQSIVLRLEYAGRSVIFAGDANERNERDMIRNISPSLLNGDVLLAGHHGSLTSSSEDFIRAVSPDYVIFSSGHFSYGHPKMETVQRFIDNGVQENRILRTDYGDDEKDDTEWSLGRIEDNTDPSGDDCIDIYIFDDGNIFVGYADLPNSLQIDD